MRTLIMLALAAAVPAMDIHLGGYAGAKQGDSALEPVDSQFEYGLVGHLRPPLFPVGIQLNAFESRQDDEENRIDSSLKAQELQIGIGRVFDPLILIHPFIAAGATHATLDIETSGPGGSADSSANGWGYFIQGGAYVSLGIFEVGVLAGFSRADVDFGTDSVNAGGKRIGLIVGLGW